jgi:hypothetical protein
MRENCKHVVATLLNLGETTDIGRFGGNGNASARDDAGYPEPSPATLDWLDALDQAPVRTAGRQRLPGRGWSICCNRAIRPASRWARAGR